MFGFPNVLTPLIKNTVIKIILILIIFIISIQIRIIFFKNQNNYLESDFFGESAFYYRYAKMIAEGNAIPDVDYKSSSVGDYKTSEDTLLNDYICGYLYKIINLIYPVDFHIFIRIIIPFFFSLNCIPLFLLVQIFTNNFKISLLSIFFYLFIPLNVIYSTPEYYSKENFILFFILLHLSFWFLAIKKNRNSYFLFSAIFLIISLCGWKLTQIYYAAFSFIILLVILYDANFLITYKNGLLIFVILLICAPFLIIHLFKQKFYFSVSQVSLYIILIILFLKERIISIKLKMKNIFLIIIIIILTGVYFSIPVKYRFEHIRQSFYYNIKYFLSHPLEPSLISPESRFYLSKSFNDEGIYFFIKRFWLLFPLSFFIILKYLKKYFSVDINIKLLVAFYFIFFFIFLVFQKLFFFYTFFAVLISMIYFINFNKWVKRILIIFILLNIIQTLTYNNNFFDDFLNKKIRENKEFSYSYIKFQRDELFYFIKKYIPKNKVILTDFYLSSEILQKFENSIVLNTCFENYANRQKIIEFAYLLYQDNLDLFFNYCKKNKVDFFILPAYIFYDDNIFSYRYIADALIIDENSLIYKFMFNNNIDNRFYCLYETSHFKIFSLSNKILSNQKKIYFPLFDKKVYEKYGRNILRSAAIGYSFYDKGKYYEYFDKEQEAIENFQISINEFPYIEDAFYSLGRLLFQNYKYDEAYNFFQKILIFDPDNETYQKYYYLTLNQISDINIIKKSLNELILKFPEYNKFKEWQAEFYIKFKEYKLAVKIYEEIIKSNSNINPTIYNNIAYCYSQIKNNLDLAENYLKKAIQIDRAKSFIYKETLSDVYIAKGDKKNAKKVLNELLNQGISNKKLLNIIKNKLEKLNE